MWFAAGAGLALAPSAAVAASNRMVGQAAVAVTIVDALVGVLATIILAISSCLGITVNSGRVNAMARGHAVVLAQSVARSLVPINFAFR